MPASIVTVPHVLAPPMPQVCPAGHAGHVSVPPQPSGAVPHCAPSAAHVVGVHWLGRTTPHASGARHVPQSSRAPHPLLTEPQFAISAAHVVGVHGPTPHRFGVPPPPQVSPATLHVPQSSEPPHPSPCIPHVAPSSAQVLGVPAGTQALVGPQRSVAPQVPHESTPPQPSLSAPQVALALARGADDLVGLLQRDRDDAGVVPGDGALEEVEREASIEVVPLALKREAELVERVDQAALCGFELEPEALVARLREVRNRPRQRARAAERSAGGHGPVARLVLHVVPAEPDKEPVTRAVPRAVRARDRVERHDVASLGQEREDPPAAEARDVLEEDELPAVIAVKDPHRGR